MQLKSNKNYFKKWPKYEKFFLKSSKNKDSVQLLNRDSINLNLVFKSVLENCQRTDYSVDTTIQDIMCSSKNCKQLMLAKGTYLIICPLYWDKELLVTRKKHKLITIILLRRKLIWYIQSLVLLIINCI